eukprot:365983-Chlamydomonas_euryale.AAC.24
MRQADEALFKAGNHLQMRQAGVRRLHIIACGMGLGFDVLPCVSVHRSRGRACLCAHMLGGACLCAHMLGGRPPFGRFITFQEWLDITFRPFVGLKGQLLAPRLWRQCQLTVAAVSDHCGSSVSSLPLSHRWVRGRGRQQPSDVTHVSSIARSSQGSDVREYGKGGRQVVLRTRTWHGEQCKIGHPLFWPAHPSGLPTWFGPSTSSAH